MLSRISSDLASFLKSISIFPSAISRVAFFTKSFSVCFSHQRRRTSTAFSSPLRVFLDRARRNAASTSSSEPKETPGSPSASSPGGEGVISPPLRHCYLPLPVDSSSSMPAELGVPSTVLSLLSIPTASSVQAQGRRGVARSVLHVVVNIS